MVTKDLDNLVLSGGKAIFVCDSHNLTDPEINKPYPPHCLENSIESEIVDSLSSIAKDSIVLKKNTLSIFLNTKLERVLNNLRPDIIEVVGVCTEICILFAIYELRIRGYNVLVSRKGVLPLDSGKQNDCLLYFQNRLGAIVVS
ncbi:MAG: cysteine hydrolase [Lewinellaceae bacterium]|nr:cysteine hydrolase [Lewinellaceae bacterium]